MAGAGAGGAGMAMTAGVAFGGNAMAAPATFSTFEPPPTGPGAGAGAGAAGAAAGRGGGGGAYDLRAWEKEEYLDEDVHACLGLDVGTLSIKVRLCCQELICPRRRIDPSVAQPLCTVRTRGTRRAVLVSSVVALFKLGIRLGSTCVDYRWFTALRASTGLGHAGSASK